MSSGPTTLGFVLPTSHREKRYVHVGSNIRCLAYVVAKSIVLINILGIVSNVLDSMGRSNRCGIRILPQHMVCPRLYHAQLPPSSHWFLVPEGADSAQVVGAVIALVTALSVSFEGGSLVLLYQSFRYIQTEAAPANHL